MWIAIIDRSLHERFNAAFQINRVESSAKDREEVEYNERKRIIRKIEVVISKLQ